MLPIYKWWNMYRNWIAIIQKWKIWCIYFFLLKLISFVWFPIILPEWGNSLVHSLILPTIICSEDGRQPFLLNSFKFYVNTIINANRELVIDRERYWCILWKLKKGNNNDGRVPTGIQKTLLEWRIGKLFAKAN